MCDRHHIAVTQAHFVFLRFRLFVCLFIFFLYLFQFDCVANSSSICWNIQCVIIMCDNFHLTVYRHIPYTGRLNNLRWQQKNLNRSGCMQMHLLHTYIYAYTDIFQSQQKKHSQCNGNTTRLSVCLCVRDRIWMCSLFTALPVSNWSFVIFVFTGLWSQVCKCICVGFSLLRVCARKR